MKTITQLNDALQDSNVRAFLKVIRWCEGTYDVGGYSRLFGGGAFHDYSDHPRSVVTKGKWKSTAAGAYQFLSRTWDDLVKKYGFSDFSPQNQDLGAVALIDRRRALDDVLAGRLGVAVEKCNREWASLPGSPYGQPVKSMADVVKRYLDEGGRIEEKGEVTTMPIPAIVGAIATAAIPTLISKLPELAAIFSDKDKSSREKNVEAAVKVLETVRDVTGAANAQEAIEKLDDPEVVQVVRERVREQWYELQQSPESVRDARLFALEYADKPRNWPLEIVTYAFITVFGVAVLRVLWNANFSDDQITMVLQAAIGLSLMVGGFWLGASFTTSKSRGVGAEPTQ